MVHPVQSAGVQILYELFQFVRNVYVGEFRKGVHVSETVDHDQRQIVGGFAQVMQRMLERFAVRREEMNCARLLAQLTFDELGVLSNAVRVARLVEQNHERYPILGQLLGIVERDLANQRNALRLNPFEQLVEVHQRTVIDQIVSARLQFGVLVDEKVLHTPVLVSHRRLAGRPEEVTLVLQNLGHLAEQLVFLGGVRFDAEVADYGAFRDLHLRLDIVRAGKMNNRIFK